MKENIEVKDVQRTEYLDKNGLDMLWTKVKENTRNQVEVERNRATTQENIIIETKADKSELHSSYVSSSTFTALQEKVAANTDAIRDKQDAGNYLSYKTLNNEGYYEIPAIRINNSGDSTKTDIDSQSISVNCDYPASHTTITCDGISNTDNNANHVYATDGSIADLTQYAKKSEITARGNVDDVQVNGVTVVENKIANIKPATKESLGVVKVGDGLNVTDGTISVDSTAIGTGNYIPYREKWMDWYYLPYGATLKFQKNGSTPGSAIVRPGAIETMHYDTTNKIDTTISIGGNENYYFKGIRLYTNGDNRVTLDDHSLTIFDGNGSDVYDVVKLNADGIKLHNGDNNHVLTSNASTIDITQYALKSELPTAPTKVSQLQNDSEFITKSVYDEKIAALEARIAALEAKHTETA